ncbi:MAG: hypothetical protein ACPF8V_01060 [Luteibaculum sp.]
MPAHIKASRLLIIFLLAAPLVGLAQRKDIDQDTLICYRNVEELNSKKSTIIKGKIAELETKWTGIKRYKLLHYYPDEQVKWLNIFQGDSLMYLSSTVYREGPKYLIEIADFNGNYGFFRDVPPALERGNGKVVVAAIMFGAVGVVLAKDAIEDLHRDSYNLFIWLAKTGHHYAISDPVMKSLLRGHDELLEEWRADPSEEKTIEVLRRKHEVDPIIG